MSNWITQNSDLLQVVVSFLTALVWIAYLQLLLSSFLRQRRSKIMINRGAGVGLDARCFVSNLGFEPIYLLEIVMDITDEEAHWSTIITDRDERSTDQLANPRDATNQGPLKSGESTDIGSFSNLIERARLHRDRGIDADVLREVRLTVVATSAASSAVVGAHRTYRFRKDELGRTRLTPTAIAAEQIRSRRARRTLRREMQKRL